MAGNAEDKSALSEQLNHGAGDSDPEADVSQINEKSLLRKLDVRLLPAVGILYLLSFLDRSNVGNARIEGMLDDLHMLGDEYLTGLTLYFVGYVLFEVPCNIILKRTTPRLWLPTLTIAWGVVATLLGIVQDRTGFLIARFFLGVAESGLFPGVVYYFSMWYKRRERQYRISLFFSAASLAGAFGGVLAYEGIATVLVAFSAYWFIHDYPDTSKFLSEKERRYIHERLAADSDSTNDEIFSWVAVKEALGDPSCWLYAQLLTIPPYAFAFVTTLVVAVLSERYGQRAIFIGGSAIFAAIGYGILLGNTQPTVKPGISYLGTFFAAGGIYPASALVLSWPAINVSGQTKRAVANGMQISIGNLGAVLGTQLYRTNSSPRFILGHSFALGYLVLNAVLVTILGLRLKKQNKQREGIAEEIKHVGEVAGWKGDSDPRWRFEY
ncbi:hypothetical protein SLS62_005928 [Diatrype stigma]|uniref:Major facilitator superfamily (MFS) profile domain-containing protein n=1 Tax=Diatrype stigma TaxID=117547 RepID=A0AAN9UNH0_9PEZI